MRSKTRELFFVPTLLAREPGKLILKRGLSCALEVQLLNLVVQCRIPRDFHSGARRTQRTHGPGAVLFGLKAFDKTCSGNQ